MLNKLISYDWGLSAATLLLITVGFVLDVLTPLGLTLWQLYFVALIVSSFVSRRSLPLFVAWVASVLIVCGYFLSPFGVDPWIAVSNRAMGLAVLWFAALALNKGQRPLKEYAKKYAVLFENMREVFQIVEPILDNEGKPIDFKYLEVNRAAEGFIKRKVNEIVGTSAKQLWGRVEDDWLEMLGSVLRTGEPAYLENYSRELDTFYDVLAWKLDSKRVVILFTDVTRRKHTEIALRESEERLRRITDSADVGLTRISSDLIYVAANPAYARITGLNERQILGHHMSEVLGVEGLELLRPFIDRVLKGEPVTFDSQLTFSASGERYLHVNYTPDYRPDGTIQGWVASVTDISERKKAEENTRMVAELQRTSEMKDEFLATLSHELRTPLTCALMWVQMISQKRLAPEKFAEAIAAIEKSMLTQNQLIEDLLDVSRMISGKIFLVQGDHQLNLLVEQSVESVLPLASEKGIQIRASFDHKIGSLSCDDVRIKQVLWNILSNAIKFSNPNCPVSIETSLINDAAVISVTDEGKGIKPEFVPFVFERFRQEEGSLARKFGGLGLGLSIVQEFVKLHGGTVSVESKGEGFGAKFTVVLPLVKRTAPADMGRPKNIKQEVHKECDLVNTRILIVDDDALSRRLLIEVLRSFGAEVVDATCAKDAYDMLQKFKPDLLLSDISMPEEDGLSLMRRIRRLPSGLGGRTPAIALTACASTEDAQKILQAGFEKHLAKPVEIKRLGSVISECIKAGLAACRPNF